MYLLKWPLTVYTFNYKVEVYFVHKETRQQEVLKAGDQIQPTQTGSESQCRDLKAVCLAIHASLFVLRSNIDFSPTEIHIQPLSKKGVYMTSPALPTIQSLFSSERNIHINILFSRGRMDLTLCFMCLCKIK